MVRVKISRDSIDQLQEAKERYDKQSELLKKLDSPPPAGLIPVGDTGLYRTPDTISPKDCEFYPDSPYCGGNPITRDSVGLDIDYGVDGCSIHASVTPKLGFMKLPTHTIAYVREECRDEYEKREKENATPKVPPPPEDFDIQYNPEPTYRPPGFSPNDIVCAATITLYFENIQQYYAYLGAWGTAFSSTVPSVEYVKYPGDTIVDSWDFRNQNQLALANIKGEAIGFSKINEIWRINAGFPADRPLTGTDTYVYLGAIPFDLPLANSRLYGNWRSGSADEGNYRYNYFFPYALSYEMIKLYVGKYGDIFPNVEMKPTTNTTIQNDYRAMQISHTIPVFCRKLDEKPKEPKIPPNDRKRKCCMQCCGSQTGQGAQRQQQDLEDIKKMLRQILKNQGDFPYSVTLFDTNEEKQGAQTKNVSVGSIAKATKLAIERTEKTNKMVGIDEFPIYVPGSIINDESNGIFGDLKDLKNALIKKKIGSIAELIAWKVEQDNNIFGKWQEVIEMEVSPAAKDKDGRTTSPSKKERIVLPNMSRTLKELVILSQTQLKILGFVMDTTLKLAVDLAGTKIEIAQAHAVIRDIQDFLDYPTQEKLLEVPIQVTIPASTDSVDDKEDLQRFLTESKAKAKYEDWTGEQSLNDLMVSLLDAAAMIRAVFYQKT